MLADAEKKLVPVIVMVESPPFTGSVKGQTLLMVGVLLLTVRFTATFCDLAVTDAPDATMVILPVYAAACGTRLVAFTVTVNATGSPGRTTPTPPPEALATASHADPDVAVYEIGAPFVDSVMVWLSVALGYVKASAAGLTDSDEGAAVTFRFTVMLTGFATPATVTTMVALYAPTCMVVGFTRTLRLAGRFPPGGETINQSAFVGGLMGVMATLYVGLPALAFTETVCAAGNVAAPA